jgi:ribA/ribD-fused uncharacterized protein
VNILFNSQTPEYAWLSNFWPADMHLEIDGRRYRFTCVEGVYQALKNTEWTVENITPFEYMNGWEARKAGKAITLRHTWNDEKAEIMRLLSEIKYQQHPDLLQALIATGDDHLWHLSPWDGFWGAKQQGDSMVGLNMLGEMLMDIRSLERW